jgi:hypothetical protein
MWTLTFYQTFAFVTSLTGIPCNWKADCVENAILLLAQLHKLFGAWKLYLEWTPNGEVLKCFYDSMWRMKIFKVFVRARSGHASPEGVLSALTDTRGQILSIPGVLVDTPLKPRHDTSINDVDRKFFVVHKFIGDIVFMVGEADPDNDEDDEDDEEACVTSRNIDVLFDKLKAPDMDLLPRVRDGMFGSRLELVPKTCVW